MALISEAMAIIHRQQERATNLRPPEGLWQMPTLYDDEIAARWRRLMAEQHENQQTARAITNVPAALTDNRHNKRLLLCQP